jgi:hypothetical protein
MKPATITTLFVLFWMVQAVAWDIWVLRRWGPEATISTVTRGWVDHCPFLALLLGALLWHLFRVRGQ